MPLSLLRLNNLHYVQLPTHRDACEKLLCSTDKRDHLLYRTFATKKTTLSAQICEVSGPRNRFENNVSKQRNGTNATEATLCGQNNSKSTRDEAVRIAEEVHKEHT